LETLQGRVTHVRHTTHVSGNGSRTTTRHIAIFEIGGVLVTYYGAAPVVIEQGDEVRVVGTPGEGERMLDALAYHNLTRDVVDDGMARPGCACITVWLAACAVAVPLVVALLTGESPVTMAREVFPVWVWIALAALVVLAVAADRRRAALRHEVLALLEGEGAPPVANG
jgi:hypothetical protein